MIRKDGTKVQTTVRKDGKGRRILIVTEEAEEGAPEGAQPKPQRRRVIELKLDGDTTESTLRGALPQLPKGLTKTLRGVRLGELDLDLDFTLDPEELDKLDEALGELPEEALPVPSEPGRVTATADGERWRLSTIEVRTRSQAA